MGLANVVIKRGVQCIFGPKVVSFGEEETFAQLCDRHLAAFLADGEVVLQTRVRNASSWAACWLCLAFAPAEAWECSFGRFRSEIWPD